MPKITAFPAPAALALMLSCLGAAAQGAGLPQPKVDYDGTYAAKSAAAPIAVAHRGTMLRLETTAQGRDIRALVDLAHRKVTTLVDQPAPMAVTIDLDGMREGPAGLSPQLLFSSDVKLVPAGARHIAGLDCTLYDATATYRGRTAAGRLCLTAEDIVLYAATDEGGRHSEITATRIAIRPQDPALFAVPPQYAQLPLAGMQQLLDGGQ